VAACQVAVDITPDVDRGILTRIARRILVRNTPSLVAAQLSGNGTSLCVTT
jgi:hypothetical protein